MYRSVLVGLDGSAVAERGLAVAAGIARRAGAELRIVHIVDFLQPEYPQTAFDAWPGENLPDRALNYLLHTAGQASHQWKARVTAAVFEGDAARRIADEARACQADLIVLTSHGHGVLKRVWLGSVADRIIREGGPPLLLVPAALAPRGDEPFEHVLVGLDGSELSERILGPAAELADLNAARLTLLRVLENPVLAAVPAATPGMVLPMPSEDIVALELSANRYLRRVGDAHHLLAPHIDLKVVTSFEPPAGGLLEFAKAHNVDLIAVATHGYGGIRRFVLGSVADSVIRAAKTTVLVHRAQQPAD